MFTTADNTLPTAKTAGSDAGSACAKQDADGVSIKNVASTPIALPGVAAAALIWQQVTKPPSDCQPAALASHILSCSAKRSPSSSSCQDWKHLWLLF